MGKPRLIILVRHAQSEGNKNRAIHQLVPDHRVKLTDEGWQQAEEAGRRLRTLLRPDDSLQIFTSPYRRTRETTEGILRTLTAHNPPASPSPFSRHRINVYEEPRLREQDFGNFQPCSAEMERMWKERADYGHFFYRIPNGESAADAYDRVSGFNESLWRQFGDKEFPSVVVLVTHGLMTRVFLMKWYHWSVEYFEDLRNINHCEFTVMKQNTETGKYTLESQLRTWSELKRQRQEEKEEAAKNNPSRRNTLSAFLKHPESPSIPPRKWGGCPDGCDHNHDREKETHKSDSNLPPAADMKQQGKNEADDHPSGTEEPLPKPATDGATETSAARFSDPFKQKLAAHGLPAYLSPQSHTKRTPSGASTPHEMPSDDEGDYFPNDENTTQDQSDPGPTTTPPQPGREVLASAMRKGPERKPTPDDLERWLGESGMGAGKRADALGDEPDPEEEVDRITREQREKEVGIKGSVY